MFNCNSFTELIIITKRITMADIKLFQIKNNKVIELEKGFTKDFSDIGHNGIGNLEMRIKFYDDLERAKPLILKSYKKTLIIHIFAIYVYCFLIKILKSN